MFLLDDVRHSLRRFRKRPAFFLAAVTTLTLGIGFNTVVFSLLNLLLLKPLPVREPERLVSLELGKGPALSFPNYLDIRERNSVFSDVAAMRVAPMHVSREGEKTRLWGYLVTGNYFETLGVSPWRGRLLSPSDDVATGAHPVAVLSHACWQRRFGGSLDVVGSVVSINGYPFTIVGITPSGFLGTERLLAADIWVPFSMLREIEGRDWREYRRTMNAWSVARLKNEISKPQAEASLAVLAEQLSREYPDANEGFELHLAPVGLMGSVLHGPAVGITGALFLVSGLTLLVACANLSNLLLAQASDRRKEFALRLSLGAGRWDLSRVLLTETLLLALAGCVSGLLASFWLGRTLSALLPALEFPVASELPVDLRVLAFAASLAFLSAFAAGLLPALRSSSLQPVSAIKNETSAGRLRRLDLRDVYVGTQVVASVVLVGCALMMVHSLQSALSQRHGFNPEGAVTLRFDLAAHGYDEEKGRAVEREVARAIQDLPGVESAALASSVPFSIDQSHSTVYVEGQPVPPVSQATSAIVYQSTPGLFRALGTRLVSGRDFEERDRMESPRVAIVNQTFADRLLPGVDPLGKRFRFNPEGQPLEIVGVVEAGRYETVTEEAKPAVWLPLAQVYSRTATLVARTRLSPPEALKMMEKTVEGIAPDLLLFDGKSLESYLDLPTAPLRLTTASLGAMGGLAALLSAIGLHALVAYTASRRTREMGIRIALGAEGRDVLSALLRRTALLVGASAAVGLALALLVSRLLARWMFADFAPGLPLVAALLVMVTAVLACWAPARRALRIEPLEALRYE